MLYKKCFICNQELNKSNRSPEHVFDDAFLKRFSLYKKKVLLPNDSYLEYAKQKVPCCIECNNRKLKPIWDRINDAIQTGADAIKLLSREDLFVWLAKIYYGLHVRDSFIDLDKSDTSLGKISNQEFLKSNGLLVYMLNEILNHRNVKISLPYSLFFFDCDDSKDINEKFWFTDSRDHAFIALRVDKVLIIAFLHDFGTISKLDLLCPINNADRRSIREGIYDPFLLPKLASKIKLDAYQAIELGSFYSALASHLFPVEVRINKGNFMSWKFEGVYVYEGAPPIKGWDNSVYLDIKNRCLGANFFEANPELASADFSFIFNPNLYDYSTY